MNHLSPGLISAYNSLTDKHLAGYFSNTRIRRHLQRAGLITRSGRIVPDKEYRHKLIQRAHQRHVRECLAQAIFHKVLEMERVHQIEIKRRLEEFARRERVHKIKVERSKRYEEDIIRILSPRPPTDARGIQKQHSGPEGEHSESSESPGSSRPNTAPGKMQRPVRLKPIHSNSTTASLRRSSPYRLLESSNENDQPFNCTMESRRRLTRLEASHDISPYCLPVINNFVTPVPPATKRKERGMKVTPSGTLRGRRLRPTTSSSGADVNEDPPMLRSSVHQSRVSVNMTYFGKTVHLSHDLTDMRDEVKVFQQHCGGENLCVYKGMLREGDTFRFISRRHRGFPFSLTFFLNGLQVERLSSCCEFKHRKGSRLGGRHGHFGFSSVEGASPCYKCIIAMGLDKKPTPPPKRVKEDGGREESVISPKDTPEMKTERTGEDAASHSECETSQPQDMETQVKEETKAEEDKVRDDYEEDFEADDEGAAEDAEAKEKKSPSPSSETQRQVQEKDASETEDDEKEDADIKSRSGSSSSGSDQEESDAEADKDSREDEKAEQPKEVDQEETAGLPDDTVEPNPEEAAATEAESAVAKDSDMQNSAGDSTEIDISDSSVPSGNKNKQSDDTSGEKEIEKTVDESKQEEEQERAKSVQEKLAEAILKESQCSSEPELSDTSTEEEEESADKGPEQDNNDAVEEKSVICTEQLQTLIEETKCEEGVEAEVAAQDEEETSDPKEQEDETEQESHQDSDKTEDERVKIDEEDEKAVSEENTAENNKAEDTEDSGLHPVYEEAMDDKTSEPQQDAAAKSTDAAEKDEENEEKTAAEADAQPDETGQGAKSSEEDESSVPEPDKKTDETAVPDNAEAEAMTVSETMEMKAEPSEEQEALDCEEAPVTDAEKRQQGDSKDGAAASDTEVTAENSSSSLEGSGNTTIEKPAETSGDNAKYESNKDTEEEEAEEVPAEENQQERSVMGEEQAEKSVEIDDKAEEKSEEEGKEEVKQTNPDEITEADKSEESKVDDRDSESKTEERVENEEENAELTKSDSNTEGKEQAEKTHSEGDEVVAEEKADESEKTERDEDSEHVKNENDIEESEEKGAATDKTNEDEKISETNTAADEEKDDEAEKEEKDQNAEQSEAAKKKDDEESEEKKVITDESVKGEEVSDEVADEPEKSADAVLDKDNVKISDEIIVESEDAGDGEAANETKTTEETLNDAMEAEDVKKETERGSNNGENGEIDAENGEISSSAENKTEGEAQTESKTDMKTAEHAEDEIQTEEAPENENTEVKEVTVESGDGAEKHEDDKVDRAPDTDVVESEAKDGDDGVEKQDESTKNNSEPDTSGMEIKEKSDDRKDSEENTKQDENGNISEPDHENRDSDLTKKSDNVHSNVGEVKAASSGDQEQSATPIAVDLEDTAQTLDESTEPSKPHKHPHNDENSAADRENGDTEEASKASEEGASVLLKPQAQSSPLTQNNKPENTEESVAVRKDTPEDLVREDSADLVSNWVTMHQASKFFETFVEPLEDLKESQVHNSAQSKELLRSESPLKMLENAEQGQRLKDVNESRGQTKEEAVESERSEAEGGEPCEKDAVNDTMQVEEETEVKDLIPEAESEPNDKESVKGQHVRSEEIKGSLEEDKVQESLMQDNTEQIDVSKTEVESIAGTHHSVTSGRPQSVPENQTEQKTADNSPDLNEKQPVEEMKDPLPSSKTEEHRERSKSPEGLAELKADQVNDTKEMWEKNREVTEITDFTEDGAQEESHHKETQPKSSDASINGDRGDVQLIQDVQHTLSKERLSTFSVDETLFGQSSYPLSTAARTESGH